MIYEIWIAFVIASALVVLIPGPNIVLTVTYAIQSGKRSGLATIPGVAVGAILSMSLSLRRRSADGYLWLFVYAFETGRCHLSDMAVILPLDSTHRGKAIRG